MAATDFQSTKIDRTFANVDIDGNGFVERRDFQGLAYRLMDQLGTEPASREGRAVVDAFEALWDAMAEVVGKGKNGSLYPMDYRRAMVAAFVEGDLFDPIFRPAFEAMLAIMDRDGDGFISEDEFLAFHSAHGRPASDCALAFENLDTDKDGQLSVEELLTVAREYYTSPDSTAKGNWLYGGHR